MTLDAAKANALTAAISAAFAAIGTTAATKMPPSKRKTEAAAWEYHVASLLARIAEARKKKVHAAAVKAGGDFRRREAAAGGWQQRVDLCRRCG